MKLIKLKKMYFIETVAEPSSVVVNERGHDVVVEVVERESAQELVVGRILLQKIKIWQY